MKVCSKCGKEQPYSEFRKDKSKSSGYYPSCNDCNRLRTGATKKPVGQLTLVLPNQKRVPGWHLGTDGYIQKSNVRQHRFIMEEHLGRKLLKSEHHRIHPGRDRHDNSKMVACTVCGAQKRYDKGAAANRLSTQYRCYKCYTTVHLARK